MDSVNPGPGGAGLDPDLSGEPHLGAALLDEGEPERGDLSDRCHTPTVLPQVMLCQDIQRQGGNSDSANGRVQSTAMTAETFREVVRRHMAARGFRTQGDLVRAAANLEVEGAGQHKITQSLQDTTRPNLPVMQAVAEVLDIHPDEFLEYRLLFARLALDERVVTPEVAAENLRQASNLGLNVLSPASQLSIETAAREAARPRGRPPASRETPLAEGGSGASS